MARILKLLIKLLTFKNKHMAHKTIGTFVAGVAVLSRRRQDSPSPLCTAPSGQLLSFRGLAWPWKPPESATSTLEQDVSTSMCIGVPRISR